MPIFNCCSNRQRPTSRRGRRLVGQLLESRKLLAAGLDVPVSIAQTIPAVEFVGNESTEHGELPSVAVLTNDADSRIRDNPRVYAADNPMRDVIVADIDADGIDDLVRLSNDQRAIGENVFVELGNGNEIQHSFAPRTDRVEAERDLISNAIAVGDIDGDQRLDIIVSNPSGPDTIHSRGITIHTQLPDGNFARRTVGSYGITAGDIQALAIGDVDGDSFADVVAGFGTGEVVVFRGNQDGLVSFGKQLDGLSFRTNIVDLEIKNLDSDLPHEIVLAGSGFGDTGVWVVDAKEPAAAKKLPMSGSRKPTSVALGKLDQGDSTDIVVVATGNQNILGMGYYYANDGRGRFDMAEFETGIAPAHDAKRDYRNHPSFVSLADSDSDGRADKIMVGHSYQPNHDNLRYQKTSDYIYEIDVVSNRPEPELPVVSIHLSAAEIVEDGGTATLTLSTPGPVRIPLNGEGRVQAKFRILGDARLGEDFKTSDLSVSLNPGLGRATVRIDALADSLPEGVETVILQLAEMSGGTVEGNTTFEIAIVEPAPNGIFVGMDQSGQTLTFGLGVPGRVALIPVRSPGPGGWGRPGTRADLLLEWNGVPAARLPGENLTSLTTLMVIGSTGPDHIDLSAINTEDFSTLEQTQIWAGDGSDTVLGSQLPDKIFGGSGNDELRGKRGNDLIFGQADDDEIYGGAGNDDLFGGDGDDRIEGGAGNDILNGDSGRDTLYGGDGNDRLIGGESVDKLFGQRGKDTLVVDRQDKRYGIVSGGRGKTRTKMDQSATNRVQSELTAPFGLLVSPNVDAVMALHSDELDRLHIARFSSQNSALA